jgi:hypothetical protein
MGKNRRRDKSPEFIIYVIFTIEYKWSLALMRGT